MNNIKAIDFLSALVENIPKEGFTAIIDSFGGEESLLTEIEHEIINARSQIHYMNVQKKAEETKLEIALKIKDIIKNK